MRHRVATHGILRTNDGDIAYVVDLHGANAAEMEALKNAASTLDLTIDWPADLVFTSTVADVIEAAIDAEEDT
jgi:hypothetical protein